MRPVSGHLNKVGLVLICLAALASGPRGAMADTPAAPSGLSLPYPILFVTQLPIRADFTTIGSTFGNHLPRLNSAGRGGDLWIRYTDGSLKNLTAAAGYGEEGMQGAGAIAVRDPSMHWDGEKAVFSMVVGAPTVQYQEPTTYWQLYEISGLGADETPLITKVPNQPAAFNNISPLYASDDRILFTSDRPRNGQSHLYPQLDEYELAPTNTGMWSLDPANGDLRLLNHAPSGNFTPIIDSFGRVIFTQWDHLQRDQQADADASAGTPGENCYAGGSAADVPYDTFNYSDESAGAAVLDDRTEVFPEPRPCRQDLLAGTNLAGHRFNHFFPWMMNQDGTGSETLNHIGRQELHGYVPASLTDDPALEDYYGQYNRFNPHDRSIENMFQVKEDPLRPGTYYGVEAPEFATHASGQVISMTAPPSLDADHMAVTFVTHEDTSGYTDDPSPDHSGHYREPLPLSDGKLVAVHTPQTDAETNSGQASIYDFRLKVLTLAPNGFWEAGAPLTGGISKSISYWSPDVMFTYSGELWELNPVEVRSRPRPPAAVESLAGPEQQMLDQAGVLLAELQAYLKINNLALIVSRDVTTRDDMDLQQPFNLAVAGGGAATGGEGTQYEVAYMQIFQADQLRGWLNPGRRVLAQPLHEPAAVLNNPANSGPTGSVRVAADGSMAAFVPAARALTWQLTDTAGEGVVRERYWVTFQPGEVRVCTSCHGLNETDQDGNGTPQNPPQALLELMAHWQTIRGQTERMYLPAVTR